MTFTFMAEFIAVALQRHFKLLNLFECFNINHNVVSARRQVG